jgi:adenylate cyclase
MANGSAGCFCDTGFSFRMTRLRDLLGKPPRQSVHLPAWIDRLLSVGIVSTDPYVIRRQRFVNVCVLATIGSTISHIVMHSLHDFYGLIVINIYNVFIIFIPMLIPQLHRFGENVGAIALTILLLFGHSLVVCLLGLASDLQVYFTFFPSVFLLLVGVQQWRLFIVFFVLFLAALLTLQSYAPVDGLLIPQDEKFRDTLSQQAMINTMSIIAAIFFYALTALDRAEVEAQNEHARSEALIETMMPRAIATRLKSGEERIADRIEMLSVMFADLAGFTEAAHSLAPEQVVEFLDGLVRACDALCQRYGADKIKTIGDSYMAAAGFDGRPAEGAAAIGRLALAMMEVIAQQPPLGGRKLRLRAGIHCGPATAGVIGDTRFSYDVWGDAVNTASRMESHGEPGRIQVSEAFRNLAADHFVFEERGATDIKSLGATRTFFLVGPRD